MTTFEKLKNKIEKDCDLVVTNFRCIHTGRVQKSMGAWSWCAEYRNTDVGSPFTASYLVKCKKLQLHRSHYKDYGDIEILPLEI